MKLTTVLPVGMLAIAMTISPVHAAPSSAAPVAPTHSDCTAASGNPHAICKRVPCNPVWRGFAGTWVGRFMAYVRRQSTPATPVFRPYHDAVTYAPHSCLKNAATGDTFVVGHRIDRYPAFDGLPAKVDKGLLVMGRKADGTRFMRTIDPDRGTHDYTLTYLDGAARLAIWTLQLPAAHGQPAMTFTVIDARDFGALPARQRDVTISMRVGTANHPYWQGVIAYGSHRLATH